MILIDADSWPALWFNLLQRPKSIYTLGKHPAWHPWTCNSGITTRILTRSLLQHTYIHTPRLKCRAYFRVVVYLLVSAISQITSFLVTVPIYVFAPWLSPCSRFFSVTAASFTPLHHHAWNPKSPQIHRLWRHWRQGIGGWKRCKTKKA